MFAVMWRLYGMAFWLFMLMAFCPLVLVPTIVLAPLAVEALAVTVPLALTFALVTAFTVPLFFGLACLCSLLCPDGIVDGPRYRDQTVTDSSWGRMQRSSMYGRPPQPYSHPQTPMPYGQHVSQDFYDSPLEPRTAPMMGRPQQVSQSVNLAPEGQTYPIQRF